jgi:drug/metabolite transporter (DMT)-like permease
MSTTPMFVLVFSAFFTKGKAKSPKDAVTPTKLIGIAVGFVGVVVICLVSTLTKGSKSSGEYYFYFVFIMGVVAQAGAMST